MLCPNIQQLFQLTQANRTGIGFVDLIRVACPTCQSIEVCPRVNDDEYSARVRDTETRKRNVQD